MAFSPAGPRNYRLCFKVDCVPIMYARRGERRRGNTARGDEGGKDEGTTVFRTSVGEGEAKERQGHPESTGRPIDSAILSLVLWALEHTGSWN